MIEPISWLTVIGLLLAAFIKLMDWWIKHDAQKQKDRDEEDQRIGAANNATDMLREFDRLRDK